MVSHTYKAEDPRVKLIWKLEKNWLEAVSIKDEKNAASLSQVIDFLEVGNAEEAINTAYRRGLPQVSRKIREVFLDS